jgi:hypothetical protein
MHFATGAWAAFRLSQYACIFYTNHGNSVRHQMLKDCAFFAGNAVGPTHALRMGEADVNDRRHIGFRDLCESSELTRKAHARFQNRETVCLRYGQRGHGQANEVVEIACGFLHATA